MSYIGGSRKKKCLHDQLPLFSITTHRVGKIRISFLIKCLN